jgi:hypothetical protein
MWKEDNKLNKYKVKKRIKPWYIGRLTKTLKVNAENEHQLIAWPGNTKGGSITVPLTSCLAGLEWAVWLLTIFVFICKTDYSKLVKQEVNGTVILSPLVFPGLSCCHFIEPSHSCFWWLSHFWLGSMKSLFDEKPLRWKAVSMKSLFDEKPFRWKAISMKSRFDEKPFRWKAISMKSRFDEKPFRLKSRGFVGGEGIINSLHVYYA